MRDATEFLNHIVDAWEALPGGKQVRNSDVERWLAADMAPAINAIRGFLLRPRPDGVLPPPPETILRVWTQKDAEREYVAFAEWFKERGYTGYPDLYPLTTENAMHSAWQEAAKRAALATTEGQDNG